MLCKRRKKKIKIEAIGKTAESRDIVVTKINSDHEKLPVIFIDAGLHARLDGSILS